MEQKIHQLVYSSIAESKMSLQEAQSIRDRAEAHNKKNNITGILIFRDGYFLQLLEGDKFDVHYTFKKIRDDKRHGCVQVLADHEFSTRIFPNWNMLLNNLEGVDDQLLLKVFELFQQKSDDPSKTLKALWSFYGVQN